jgi:hypothetical protein
VGAGIGFLIWRGSTSRTLALWGAPWLTQKQWRSAVETASLLWCLAAIHEAGVSAFRRSYDDFWIANEQTDGRLVVCSFLSAWIAVVKWTALSAVSLGFEFLGLAFALDSLGGFVPEPVRSNPIVVALTVSALGLVAGYWGLFVVFDEKDPRSWVRLRMVVPKGANRSWEADVPRWLAEEERQAQARGDAEQRARAEAELKGQEHEREARERLAQERERLRAELERTEAERRARAEAEFKRQEQEREARERLTQERERLRAELERTEAERRARAEAQARRRKEEEARAREQARRRQEEEESRNRGDAVAQAFAFLGLEPTVGFRQVQNRFRRRALELHPDRNGARVEWANGEMVTLNLHMDTLRRFFAEESRAREKAGRRQEEEERRSKRDAVAQAFAFFGLEPTVGFREVQNQFRRRVRELRAAGHRAGVDFGDEMRTLRLHMGTLRRFFRGE